VLGLFGDAATEVCIRADGDEGLLAAYRDVQFVAPVRAGDVVEVRATVTRVGRRSRDIEFVAEVVCRGAPERSESAADVLDPPLTAVTAVGTVVVPERRAGG
jgi:3-aminobutyryl-CoA ammonia-lyase